MGEGVAEGNACAVEPLAGAYLPVSSSNGSTHAHAHVLHGAVNATPLCRALCMHALAPCSGGPLPYAVFACGGRGEGGYRTSCHVIPDDGYTWKCGGGAAVLRRFHFVAKSISTWGRGAAAHAGGCLAAGPLKAGCSLSAPHLLDLCKRMHLRGSAASPATDHTTPCHAACSSSCLLARLHTSTAAGPLRRCSKGSSMMSPV